MMSTTYSVYHCTECGIIPDWKVLRISNGAPTTSNVLLPPDYQGECQLVCAGDRFVVTRNTASLPAPESASLPTPASEPAPAPEHSSEPASEPAPKSSSAHPHGPCGHPDCCFNDTKVTPVLGSSNEADHLVDEKETFYRRQLEEVEHHGTVVDVPAPLIKHVIQIEVDPSEKKLVYRCHSCHNMGWEEKLLQLHSPPYHCKGPFHCRFCDTCLGDSDFKLIPLVDLYDMLLNASMFITKPKET